MKRVINGIVLESNRKIFLVQKRDHWIVPGGKPNEGETDLVCLAREFQEELPGTEINQRNAFFYGEFRAQSPYSGSSLLVRAWHLQTPSFIGEPAREIRAKRWVTSQEAYDLALSDATRQIIQRLRHDHYLQ